MLSEHPLPLTCVVLSQSPKRSPFSSLVKRRTKSGEFEMDDYVCPLADKLLFSSQQNRTEEEKFLMKEVTAAPLLRESNVLLHISNII